MGLAVQNRMLQATLDYLHAALVMQQRLSPGDFALVRDLDKMAVEKRPCFAQARWLYAAATDRYLRAWGSLKSLGLKYRQVNGRRTLEPFDVKAVTGERMSSLACADPLAPTLQ